MRGHVDFTPYRQSSVGFDRLFDLLESGARNDGGDGYPPYDLVRLDDESYRIDLAVAGFGPDDVEIIAHQNQLSVTGQREKNDQGEYMYRGIATRSFDRRFQLADFVEVGSATFEDGLLSITLKRVVPDEMKPRKIEVNASGSRLKQVSDSKQKESQAA